MGMPRCAAWSARRVFFESRRTARASWEPARGIGFFARGLAVSAHQWETIAREVDGPARGIA
jgi:hypothetical protein